MDARCKGAKKKKVGVGELEIFFQLRVTSPKKAGRPTLNIEESNCLGR